MLRIEIRHCQTDWHLSVQPSEYLGVLKLLSRLGNIGLKHPLNENYLLWLRPGCEIFSDKNEMLLSMDALYPKNTLVTNLFGYTQVLSKYNKTESYRYDDFDAPSVFNLKSSNSYRHLTLTHKKENLVRDIEVEDEFYVVEYEYTDTKELSSSKVLQEDYKKYSGMFPVIERIREQLVREE